MQLSAEKSFAQDWRDCLVIYFAPFQAPPTFQQEIQATHIESLLKEPPPPHH